MGSLSVFVTGFCIFALVVSVASRMAPTAAEIAFCRTVGARSGCSGCNLGTGDVCGAISSAVCHGNCQARVE
jgi:hypothetical protein